VRSVQVANRPGSEPSRWRTGKVAKRSVERCLFCLRNQSINQTRQFLTRRNTAKPKVLCNPHHVLYNSLPNETVSFYELRHRPHNRELINKTNRLAEHYCSYISHAFLYDFTSTFSRVFYLYYTYLCYFAFCQSS